MLTITWLSWFPWLYLPTSTHLHQPLQRDSVPLQAQPQRAAGAWWRRAAIAAKTGSRCPLSCRCLRAECLHTCVLRFSATTAGVAASSWLCSCRNGHSQRFQQHGRPLQRHQVVRQMHLRVEAAIIRRGKSVDIAARIFPATTAEARRQQHTPREAVEGHTSTMPGCFSRMRATCTAPSSPRRLSNNHSLRTDAVPHASWQHHSASI